MYGVVYNILNTSTKGDIEKIVSKIYSLNFMKYLISVYEKNLWLKYYSFLLFFATENFPTKKKYFSLTHV